MEATLGKGIALEAGEPAATEATPRAAATRDLFDAHAPFVCRALACLGVRDHELSDACQEVFLVAHAKLPELERKEAIRSWLYAICLRRALAFRRRAARRREQPVADPPEPPTWRSSAVQEDDLERHRALATAAEILDGIDGEKRAVFVLSEVEQLPMHEVADIVGCPLKTAYSRLYAARREIARALARLRAGGRLP